MNYIITHSDFDGTICAALILKEIKEGKIIFSTPASIKKTLCKIIAFNEDLENLYVADISPNEKAIKLASIFQNVYWFDHHISNFKSFENVNLIIDSSKKSCARLISEFYGIESEWIDIADKIDSNECFDLISQKIRNYFYALKYYYKKFSVATLSKIVRQILDISPKEFLEKNEVKELIEKFENEINIKLQNALNKVEIKELNGFKIGLIELEYSLPVSLIYNQIKNNTDILVTIFRNGIKTKIELRSDKLNVHKIAKEFGGGGHVKASGASLNYYVSKEEIEDKIREVLPEILKD